MAFYQQLSLPSTQPVSQRLGVNSKPPRKKAGQQFTAQRKADNTLMNSMETEVEASLGESVSEVVSKVSFASTVSCIGVAQHCLKA
jgi:hypothetical protein